MKIKNLILSSFIGLALFSCVKHEIIPAPENRVDLKFHFQGYLRGTFMEFTQNVDGFDLETNKTKQIIPNALSRAVYYSMLKSSQKNISLKLLVGEALWDGLATNDPDINSFSNMFTNYTTPKFNPGAYKVAGIDSSAFDVEYKDVNGNIWKGDPAFPANLEFTYLSQESDKTGDYMKYIAKMDLTLHRKWWTYNYDNLGAVIDSVENYDYWTLENGVLQGWFKR